MNLSLLLQMVADAPYSDAGKLLRRVLRDEIVETRKNRDTSSSVTPRR